MVAFNRAGLPPPAARFRLGTVTTPHLACASSASLNSSSSDSRLRVAIGGSDPRRAISCISRDAGICSSQAARSPKTRVSAQREAALSTGSDLFLRALEQNDRHPPVQSRKDRDRLNTNAARRFHNYKFYRMLRNNIEFF